MELMVSVAILLALLAMVGTIFSTASKAGGQAQALSTVYRQLATAAESIRRDLANMDPANDTLGIAGVLVSAKNKADDPIDPSKPLLVHRADTLMLFTRRGDARPYVLNLGGVDPSGYFPDRMQVVYGHADVGQYNAATNTMTLSQRIEQAPQIPAYNWHLSRRMVFLPITDFSIPYPAGVSGNALSSTDFLSGACDTYAWSTLVVPSGRFHYAPENGLLTYAYWTDGSTGFRYDPFASSQFQMMYFDGTYWFYYDSPLGWLRTQPAPPPPPILASPQPFAGNIPIVGNYEVNNSLARLLFYNDAPANVNKRSVIDPSPPTGTSGLLANQFLPNCTDFRVEYTYDDPREVTLTRNDPLNTVPVPIYPNPDPQAVQAFTRPVNWQSVGTLDYSSGSPVFRPQQIIWSRLSTNPSDRTDPHRWPRAIRITLKAVDAGGRLAEPVTYSIVHCWK